MSIIGIPLGIQAFKMAKLALWSFGANVHGLEVIAARAAQARTSRPSRAPPFPFASSAVYHGMRMHNAPNA